MVRTHTMVRNRLRVGGRVLGLRKKRKSLRPRFREARTYVAIATARSPKVIALSLAPADGSGQRSLEHIWGYPGPMRAQDGSWIAADGRGRGLLSRIVKLGVGKTGAFR